MQSLTIGQMARQAESGRTASERCPLLEALLGAPEHQERLETAT
jgi:hypothetical protein